MHPSKGEALQKRWDDFKKNAEAAQKAQKKENKATAAKVEENKEEPKVYEVKEDEPKPKPAEQQPVAKDPPAKLASETTTSKISTYNGAETKKYNWSQSIKNVDVQVMLPKGTTSKMLKVEIKPKSLKVQIKG